MRLVLLESETVRLDRQLPEVLVVQLQLAQPLVALEAVAAQEELEVEQLFPAALEEQQQHPQQ